MGPKSGWGGVVRLSQTRPIPRSPDGDNKKSVCWSQLLKVIKVRVNSFFETCPLLCSSVAALDSFTSLLHGDIHNRL